MRRKRYKAWLVIYNYMPYTFISQNPSESEFNIDNLNENLRKYKPALIEKITDPSYDKWNEVPAYVTIVKSGKKIRCNKIEEQLYYFGLGGTTIYIFEHNIGIVIEHGSGVPVMRRDIGYLRLY